MNEQDRDYGTEPPHPEWPARRRLYRGWWVVLVGFFVLAVAARGQGVTFPQLVMEFRQLRPGEDSPQDFDIYLGLLVAVVMALVVGYAIDRFDASKVLIPIIAGVALFFFFAHISDHLWVRYFAWFVIMAFLTGALLIGFAKVAASWFRRHRGKAFAVLLAGVLLSPMLPIIRFERIMYWFLPYDFSQGVWPDTRGGIYGISLIDVSVLLALGVIPAYFVLRRRFRNSWSARREGFLIIENHEPDEEEPSVMQVDEETPTLKSILVSRPYLLLVIASGLQASLLVRGQFSIESGFSAQVAFPLREVYNSYPLSYGEPATPYVLGAFVLLLTGVLADRFDGRRVLLWAMAAQIASVIAMGSGNSFVSSMASAIIVGAGAGALSAATLLILTEYWGTRHFGVLLSILASFAVGLNELASQVFWSVMYGRTFWPSDFLLGLIVLALFAIAFRLILLIKRPHYGSTPLSGRSTETLRLRERRRRQHDN